MGIPTDYNPSIFHRELQNNLRDCATFTDGFSDGQYQRYHRRIVAHPEEHACMTRVRLREYRRLCRRPMPTASPTDCRTSRSARMSDTCPSARIPTALPTSNTDGITDDVRMSDTCPSARIPTDLPTDWKVWRDFRTLLVRISINCRRNLIPPTTINFRW